VRFRPPPPQAFRDGPCGLRVRLTGTTSTYSRPVLGAVATLRDLSIGIKVPSGECSQGARFFVSELLEELDEGRVRLALLPHGLRERAPEMHEPEHALALGNAD